MYDWSDFEKNLLECGLAKEDILLIKEFVSFLSFEVRQEIFGIFLEFPEKRDFFVEILKKKKGLAKKFDPKIAAELLGQEFKEIKRVTN